MDYRIIHLSDDGQTPCARCGALTCVKYSNAETWSWDPWKDDPHEKSFTISEITHVKCDTLEAALIMVHGS